SDPAAVPDRLRRVRLRAAARDAGDLVRADVPGRHVARPGDPDGMTATLAVRLQPGARRAGVRGRMADGTLQLAVTAPPEDGRANRALCELVSTLLGVKPRQVQLARGASSR